MTDRPGDPPADPPGDPPGDPTDTVAAAPPPEPGGDPPRADVAVALDDARFAPPDADAPVALELDDRPRAGLAPTTRERAAARSPSPTTARAPVGGPRAADVDRGGGWRVRLIALALFVLSLTLVLINQRHVGIVRDEVVYVGAGKTYARWWLDVATFEPKRTSEAGITRSWGGKGPTDNNREHPPLMKTLFGLAQIGLHDKLDVASEITASRAATAAVHALAIAILFLWVAAAWGQAEGVIAALCALFVPRALFHAGLACFDAPIASWWLLTLYAYWRGLSHRGWAVAAGVLWGCALATKHNAFLLPLAIAPHFVWVAIRAHRDPGPPRVGGAVIALGRGLRARWLSAVALIVLGPLTLIALWPWLWFDTYDHLAAWLRFHTHHVHYNFEYLGDNWNHPPFPWHVAIVTTLLTVPLATLVAAGLGVVRGLAQVRGRGAERGRTDAPGVLLILSLVVAMGPFLLGSTPIFGAEKHWAVASYTIAAAAGLGVVWAARRAAAAIAARWPTLPARPVELAAVVATAAIVVGAAAAETWHAQPYALSSYNALAGGAPGGADLGMNRQFWGYAARGVLPVLRAQAPAAGQPALPVYTHDATPAWGWYRKAGLLPASLPDAGHEETGVARSQLAIVIHERHFNRHDYLVWGSYGTVQPIAVLRFDGVPLVSVYRRPASPVVPPPPP